jgi:chromosome segregation ATPase
MEQLEQKINEHDARLKMMEDQNTRSAEQMTSLITELNTLSHSLRETVSTFREYTVKHDNLRESNVKLWAKYESQAAAISDLQIKNASNQQIINDVIAIKNKVLAVVVLAVLSPITIGVAMVFGK